MEALRTETQCIYTLQRGVNKGKRCSKPPGARGYCDNHCDRKLPEAPTRCQGQYQKRCHNGTFWTDCRYPATLNGFCNECITTSYARASLKYRCQRGKEHGQQCHRLAEKEGYCLHCIYNEPEQNSHSGAVKTLQSPKSSDEVDNVSGQNGRSEAPIAVENGDELHLDVEINIEAQTVPQASGWFGWLRSFVRKE